MCEAAGSKYIADAKVAGIEHFRVQGYRSFAMIDNQPQNLEAVAARDPSREILLLHAGTLFQSRPQRIPETAVHGNVYDLTELVPKKALPQHIQLVWECINNEAVFSEFLKSNIDWADLSILANFHVRQDRQAQQHIPMPETQTGLFYQCLQQLKSSRRGIKLDLGSAGGQKMFLSDVLQSVGMPSGDIWLRAGIESMAEKEFRYLAETHPDAVIEVPIDFLAPLILNGPRLAESVLDRLADWGVNRFALSWETPHVRMLHELLEHWGVESTIYDVHELRVFLQAVLLTPRAICSEFNFPAWQRIHCGKRRIRDTAGEMLKFA